MQDVDSTAQPTVSEFNEVSEEELMARMSEPEQEPAPQPVPEPEPDPEPVEASDTTPAEDVEDAEYEEVEEEVFAESNDDADEEPETFTVRVDGEEQSVTLEQLKQGYSGQSYIQTQPMVNSELSLRLKVSRT